MNDLRAKQRRALAILMAQGALRASVLGRLAGYNHKDVAARMRRLRARGLVELEGGSKGHSAVCAITARGRRVAARLGGATVTSLLLAAWCGTAAAQQMPCAKLAEVTAGLAEHYREKLVSAGLQANGQLLEIFASPDGATWTALTTSPAGPRLRGGHRQELAAGRDGGAVLRRAAVALALGLLSSPAAAHDFYSGLKAPDGGSCCSDTMKECHPTEMCRLPDGKEGIITEGWGCTAVPWGKVLGISSPDGRPSVCESPIHGPAPVIYCVILGSAV
jgi:DNA-binding MarR family transcriptional regulator